MSGNIVAVDEESLRDDIGNLVRRTVEETLNAPPDEEASELVGAERHGRTAGREAYRSGHYTRRLVTGAGEVELSVPKLRGATLQTAVIERYRRREISVEEAIAEMRPQASPPGDRGRVRDPLRRTGVLRHRLQPQREGLRGHRGVAPEAARRRVRPRLRRRRLPQTQPGRVARERRRLVAIGVNSSGDREAIGRPEGCTESAGSWRESFSRLKGRGPSGVRLVIGDKCAGMFGALEEVFPEARYQRCTVHFYRSVLGRVPVTKRKAVAGMLRAVHAQGVARGVRP